MSAKRDVAPALLGAAVEQAMLLGDLPPLGERGAHRGDDVGGLAGANLVGVGLVGVRFGAERRRPAGRRAPRAGARSAGGIRAAIPVRAVMSLPNTWLTQCSTGAAVRKLVSSTTRLADLSAAPCRYVAMSARRNR